MLLISLVCLVVGAIVLLILAIAYWDEYGDVLPPRISLLLIIDICIGLLANLAAGPMRRAGLWNLLLVVPGALSGSSLPATAVALARLGARRDWRVDASGLGVCAIAALASGVLSRWADGDWSSTLLIEVLLSVVFAAAALLWGRVRGTRFALISSLRSQAATAQRERAALEREHEALEREHRALVAQAESEQRAAIARDMHDSLSHHLSLIAMHAGALAYRRDMPPEQMREVADTIRGDARAANTELRDVLSALREDSAEPLPTSGSIDDLVEAARAEGQDVRLRWEGIGAGDLESAGSATVVTLVRITRELLTNARKHAPDARLELQIVRDHDDLRMSASNPVPASDAAAGTELGTGLGLTGVRERVRLLGGTFRADVRDGAHDASRDGEHGDPRDATHVGPRDATRVGPPGGKRVGARDATRVGPSGDPLARPQNAQTFEVEVRLPWRTR